jgi:hypothetical protein
VKVNPSTPRPGAQELALGLNSHQRLRVDPERRFTTPPSKAGIRMTPRRSLGAAEWVKKILIAGLVIIVGAVAAFYLFQSEEKKVRKQFRLLSEWVSKGAGENLIIMAHKTKSIGTLFAESCGLKSPFESISGTCTPEEITSYAARGRIHCSQLSLKFYDIRIRFPEKGLAKVTLTAKLTGRSSSGERFDETHELECSLKKIEKRWLFSEFEVVEVLRK